MKVAHLTTADISLRYLLLPQLLATQELGWETVGLSGPGPWVRELEMMGIRHVALPSSTRGVDLLRDFRAMTELVRALRREKPDILHTHNPKPGLYGRILGRLSGVPVIVNTVHGLYATPDDSLTKRSLIYAAEAIASRFSDAELVQSHEDFELMTRMRISPPRRTRHLGNGVDLHRFSRVRFGDVDRRDVRRELGVDQGTIVVGMVGRLVAEKGYREFFDVARRLDPRFVFVAVGPGEPDKRDRLTDEEIEAAGASGVRILGMRSDVDRLYAGMDIFVLPSHREGFPRAAMEAAAMGLPVVATDIRVCREVVEHGVTGMLVPVGDTEELAAALLALGEDSSLRERMGGAAAARARSLFDENCVVQTVLDTYHQVADRKRIPLPLTMESGELTVRPATELDVVPIAQLHTSALDRAFLSRLGPGFLGVLYRALVNWPDGTVLVAEFDGRVVGCVTGVVSVSAFYRWFVRRYGVTAGAAALQRLWRPSTVRRAWESWRYPAMAEGDGAELLTLAVSPEARGQGVGHRLVGALLSELGVGRRPIRVVVGLPNPPAMSLYSSLGFEEVGRHEVHRGEPSAVLQWPAS